MLSSSKNGYRPIHNNSDTETDDSQFEVEEFQLQVFSGGNVVDINSDSDSDTNTDLKTDSPDNKRLFEAAAKGDLNSFYHALSRLMASSEFDFFKVLKKCLNSSGQTPWHIAAVNGYDHFFAEPSDKEFKPLWKKMKKVWCNAKDRAGNTPLHLASYITDKTPKRLVERKKRIVKHLSFIKELNVNLQNNKGKTALHYAAQNGCEEICSLLLSNKDIDLTLLDQNNQSTYSVAIQQGHAMIAGKMAKVAKVKKINLFAIPHENVSPIIYAARDPHLSDEDFKTFLKQIDELELTDENGKSVNVIDLRMQALRKLNRSRNLKTVLIGTLCPASTSAAFIGSLGGFNFEPFTVSVITLASLAVIYPTTVYFCYKARSEEYGKVAAETLYQTWLSARIAKSQVKEHSNQLSNAILLLSKQIKSVSNLEELAELQEQYEELLSAKEKLQKTTSEFVSPSGLLGHKYLTSSEIKNKLKLAQNDPRENSRWTGGKESLRSLFAYKADIFCPVGAGLTVGATVGTLIMSKAGVLGLSSVGILGAALSSPIVPLVIGICATVLLTALIGFTLYNVSFKNQKAEMGKINKEFVTTYGTANDSLGRLEQEIANKNLSTIGLRLENARLRLVQGEPKKKIKEKNVSLRNVTMFKPLQRTLSSPTMHKLQDVKKTGSYSSELTRRSSSPATQKMKAY